MDDKDYISADLEGLLDEFVKIRDTYTALQTYCEVQEETMSLEKEQSDRMRENLERLSKIHMLLEKRYKSVVVELQTEKEGLLKTIEDLKEQCDHLRLINADRNTSDEQNKLQDEIEVLKAQLVMQEERHNEDVALLKQKHSDEIQRYKMLLENAKKDINSNPSVKIGKPKNRSKNKKDTSCFRWPELNVERLSNTPTEIEERNNGNKNGRNGKRKLFSEETDALIDIV